ncbi:class I SAM-dependent methyltransferase [soil metagenome]
MIGRVSTDADLLTRWRTAYAAPAPGWDFADVAMTVEEPPWSYADWAGRALAEVGSVLDLGTGGGEVLLELAEQVGLPSDTVATEGWAPNLPVASAALADAGIPVVAYDAESDPLLPFPDARFDAVINRHEAYVASEVARVLRPGGRFLTQQVDGRSLSELNALFGGRSAYLHITLEHLTAEATAAGFRVEDTADWAGSLRFADVTALVAYARRVPWEVPEDFSVDRYAEVLLELHHSDRELIFEQRRFVLLATKPV